MAESSSVNLKVVLASFCGILATHFVKNFKPFSKNRLNSCPRVKSKNIIASASAQGAQVNLCENHQERVIFKPLPLSSVIVYSSMKLMRFFQAGLLFRFIQTMNMNPKASILFRQATLRLLKRPSRRLGFQNLLDDTSLIQKPSILLNSTNHRSLLEILPSRSGLLKTIGPEGFNS